jgi:hypothetical protein
MARADVIGAAYPADNRLGPGLAFGASTRHLVAKLPESLMEELIARIVAKVGIDDSTAHTAVRIILSFLYRQGDREKVAALAGAIPGATEYIEDGEPESAATLGGLGGLAGGGAMEVLSKLQAIGLGMGDIQGVTRETVEFAREKAGADLVNDVVASIPGLGQFV